MDFRTAEEMIGTYLKNNVRSNESDDKFFYTILESLKSEYLNSIEMTKEQKNTLNSGEYTLNKEDDEHLLTKVIVFGNNTAAQYARDSYLDSHPSAHWIKNTSFVRDGEWLIRFTTARNFEGFQFNEVIIDGSLLLSVNTAGITRITNELRAAMLSERRV